MNYENYFRDLFESIEDFRKIVLIILFIKKDNSLLDEIGSSGRNITRLNLEFKNILTEQHEQYLDYIKNAEESIFEMILNK